MPYVYGGNEEAVHISDVAQHRQRHVQRIGQERPHMANRDQLQREPQPVVITTPLRDKIPVRVVEEEGALVRTLRPAAKLLIMTSRRPPDGATNLFHRRSPKKQPPASPWPRPAHRPAARAPAPE